MKNGEKDHLTVYICSFAWDATWPFYSCCLLPPLRVSWLYSPKPIQFQISCSTVAM